MNDLTQTVGRVFKPSLAVMVYESTDRENSFYLESHQINDDGQILEGKPLLQETIQGMVDVFFDDSKDKSQLAGAIPENLMLYRPLPGGHYKILWHRPAEIRMMHFAAQLKITSAPTWVPPMIYMAEKTSLSVFATKATARPKDNTKLYRAPYHNVSDDGAVCLGSAKVKKPADRTFLSAMKYWEDLFWLSEFSHFNGATNPTKTKMDDVWRRLVKSKKSIKWADLDELKESKKQLPGLLK